LNQFRCLLLLLLFNGSKEVAQAVDPRDFLFTIVIDSNNNNHRTLPVKWGNE